tara:strand:+ start:55 stop:1530 length:1476 start_codon:yes stop_codon:yes gene_type:complete
MIHRILICLILTIPLIISQVVYSEPLSLQTYIQGALAHHPSAYLDELTRIQKLQELGANDSIKDWNLFAQTTYQKGLSSTGFASFSDSGKMSQTGIGLNKVIAQTGTRFRINASQLTIQDPVSFSDTFEIPNYYDSHIQLQFVQPLLKNMWGQLDRYPLKMKELQSQLATLKYRSDLDAYVKDRTDDYLTWVYHHKERELLSAQFQKANDQVLILERQVKRGVRDLTDLVLAKQNAISKKMVLDRATVAYHTTEHQIAVFYWGQFNPKNTLEPHLESPLESPNRAIWPYVHTQSVLAESMALLEDIQLLTVSTTRHQQLPDLDLALSHTRKSLSNTASSLYDDEFENKETLISLQMTYPIGNRYAKSRHNTAVTEQKKMQQTHKETWLTVHAIINDLENHAKLAQQQASDIAELLKLSKKSAELEHEKYTQGRRNSLSFVLDAEDRVLATQIQQLHNTITQKRLYNQQHALLNTYSHYYGRIMLKWKEQKK